MKMKPPPADNVFWRKQNLLQHMTEHEFRRLLNTKQLIRTRKGIYHYAHTDFPDNDMILAQEIFPEGIISMITAASYYNLTTIIPASIQLTLSSKGARRRSLPDYPRMELFFADEKIIHLGEERIFEENHTIRIYDRERIVCDMFRYLSRIGIDAALEVFKAYMNDRKDRKIDKLIDYARQLRVYKYIHRYTEVYIA